MIEEIVGDLVACNDNIICHQVNFEGVMGGGVALSIREKLLSRRQYQDYEKFCMTHRHDALGEVLFMRIDNGKEQFVANCFSQNAFTRSHFDTITNYSAMRTCFEQVEKMAREKGYSVAMPGYMGCGIAGGDWNVVRGIVEDVFGQSSVRLTIYHLRRGGGPMKEILYCNRCTDRGHCPEYTPGGICLMHPHDVNRGEEEKE